MALEWAFDNPKLSDVVVVLTTETPDQCRTRLSSSSATGQTTASLLRSSSTCCNSATQPAAEAVPDAPSTAEAVESVPDAPSTADPAESVPNAPSTADSADAQKEPVFEEVHAHKLVLFSHSQYFEAAARWQAEEAQRSSKRHKTQHSQQQDASACGSGKEVVIISLDSAEWLPAARTMLRFMYTASLPDTTTISEVRQLYVLADQYALDSLRLACFEALRKRSLPSEWPVSEQLQLLQLASHAFYAIDTADHDATPLSKSAVSVVQMTLRWLAAGLEEIWQVNALRLAFQQLPEEMVVVALSAKTLSVRSENTVLVAALSWLRGDVGRSASLEERRSVLEAVRMLQLDSWFLSWLLCCTPEANELLRPELRTRLLRWAFAKTEQDRKQIARCDGTLRRWGTARTYQAKPVCALAPPMNLAEVEAVVVAAVGAVRAGTSTGLSLTGQRVFWCGWEYEGGIEVTPVTPVVEEGAQRVKVSHSVTTHVCIGGVDVEAGPGVLACPYPFHREPGQGVTEHGTLGTRLVTYRVLVSPGDSAEAAVAEWWAEVYPYYEGPGS